MPVMPALHRGPIYLRSFRRLSSLISDHRFLGFLVPWNRNEWIQERILCREKQSLSHPLKEPTLVIRFMGRYVRKSLGRLEVLNNL